MSLEALVVGGGPAGSLAALTLARAGARVRVIDRVSFPRDKLCGDTVNPGALAILDRVGVGGAARSKGLAIAGMIVTAAGARVAASYPDGHAGLAIRRRDLDDVLLQAAVGAGACFDPGVRAIAPLRGGADGTVTGVRVRTARGERALRCRLVVIADGRGSRLASVLGLARFARAPRRWAFGACFGDVRGLSALGEMHIRPPGYIGIAPLPGNLANVCVVREEPSFSSDGRGDPNDAIGRAVACDLSLCERFHPARQLSPVSVLGPLAVEARAAGCPGALLAGDAAGFVDPMTGDGLRFALRGGELAAEAALRELTSGVPAFRSLQAARDREFAGKYRLNRALRLLVGSTPAVRAAARVSRLWPAPVEHLIALAGDLGLAAAQRERLQAAG